MKKRGIRIGETYLAKVSGKVVPVRTTGESVYGGWNAVNTTTGREVRIRRAARLRCPLDTSTPALVPPAAEADRPAATLRCISCPAVVCELRLLQAMPSPQFGPDPPSRPIFIPSEGDSPPWSAAPGFVSPAISRPLAGPQDP
jgi:hypothetical protein